MIVLGIETSCDETGIALYCTTQGLLAHALYSQVALHAPFGGVVPELASRDHIRKTLPLIRQVLEQAKIQSREVSAIAYTAGPGLIGALLVGASIAKGLAYAWQVPALAVHHMEGHLLAPMLEADPPPYPFVALLVSGGHTLLVAVHGLGEYEVLGESLDDAAGEAFDKTAKMLGLGYPGGPALAKQASLGNAYRFQFPRPMLDRPGLDFSFSGLKTAVLNVIKQPAHQLILNQPTHLERPQLVADICASFQQAVVDTLVAKCQRALIAAGMTRLVIAGGVSANHLLREQLSNLASQGSMTVYYPRLSFCTDNGAMIAYAGAQRLLCEEKDTDLAVRVKARWPLDLSTAR